MYNPIFVITNEILIRISKIEELKTRARLYQILPEREAFVHKRATVESAHSSTSIEGNPLNLKQVEKVLTSDKSLTKEQYAEIEVKNYKKSLDWISHRKQENRPLCLEDILKLHAIITHSLLDESRSGKIRRYPVHVVNPSGKTVYEGPAPEEIVPELKALFTWLNTIGRETHPVIVAGIIHFMLVSIHPFADGNGRTTRATVSLYLSLVNYDFRECLVLDSYYAVDKKAYYDALKLVQKGSYLHAKNVDITPWLNYFTEGFLSSAEVLAIELQSLSVVQSTINHKRITRDESELLSYATDFGSIDLSEAQEILPNVSRRTVQRILNKLVSAGLLQMVGDGPSTKYILPSKEVA